MLESGSTEERAVEPLGPPELAPPDRTCVQVERVQMGSISDIVDS